MGSNNKVNWVNGMVDRVNTKLCLCGVGMRLYVPTFQAYYKLRHVIINETYFWSRLYGISITAMGRSLS